jgi:hypothetical protein
LDDDDDQDNNDDFHDGNEYNWCREVLWSRPSKRGHTYRPYEVKCHKVKHPPLKGGCTYFGTLRYKGDAG